MIPISPEPPESIEEAITLRCKKKTSSNLTTDNEDDLDVSKDSMDEMIIPSVSKSDEGLYKCTIMRAEKSTESWLIVRGETRKKNQDLHRKENEPCRKYNNIKNQVLKHAKPQLNLADVKLLTFLKIYFYYRYIHIGLGVTKIHIYFAAHGLLQRLTNNKFPKGINEVFFFNETNSICTYCFVVLHNMRFYIPS